MTKKDYLVIGDAIRHAYYRKASGPVQMRGIAIVASLVADAFQKDNPQFNRDKWWNYVFTPLERVP